MTSAGQSPADALRASLVQRKHETDDKYEGEYYAEGRYWAQRPERGASPRPRKSGHCSRVDVPNRAVAVTDGDEPDRVARRRRNDMYRSVTCHPRRISTVAPTTATITKPTAEHINATSPARSPSQSRRSNAHVDRSTSRRVHQTERERTHDRDLEGGGCSPNPAEQREADAAEVAIHGSTPVRRINTRSSPAAVRYSTTTTTRYGR